MSKLCVNLPPFAPDYSGVASTLFELGGMIVIHDASGCTGNYLGYDEPRWLGSKSLVFCSGLRHMDAILGNDDLLIQRIVNAVNDTHPKFVALLGSPVPMVIGTDYEGIATELESRTGIPCFGFDTKGLAYYTKGVSMAIVALLKKFCPKKSDAGGTVAVGNSRAINLLGTTPLDFGNTDNVKRFVSLFQSHGIKVLNSFGMENSLENIQLAADAALNLVVSGSGYEAAVYMKKTYGIPFVCETPVGDGGISLRRVQDFFDGDSDSEKECGTGEMPELNGTKGERIFIAGDQVISNSIRNYMEALSRDTGKSVSVRVGNLFDAIPALQRKNDLVIKDELELRTFLNSGECDSIVADPLVEQLLTAKTKEQGVQFFGLPHTAVSSKICWDKTKLFLSEEFTSFITEVL